MTAEVLFASCRKLPEGDGDEYAVLPALADVGVRARWAVWDDDAVDFAAADLVVLRATWDYSWRREEFVDWCASVPGVRNAAEVVRWNTDKRYLTDLAADGVPVVPTTVAEPGMRPDWPDGEFVVKPAVGAGSVGAKRFGAAEAGRAAEHLATLHADDRVALVQPYQARVDAEGETALVFFGGLYSHAFTKGAMLTGAERDGSGLFVSEKRGVTEPGPAARALAENALDAASGRFGLARADLLYARVDVVTADDGTPALLELELTEPSLRFDLADAAAPYRFASAVRAHLA
ncbi:ATP-grasp domain-containing protein [Saccharomonospora saliphila]|uniref:hypothetical protein n=1 Tax=Saccharomonospora saliphila TaxID=369829 RepID=UPI00035D034F|nr:hypothetical protein [Saccharomonospora saliphila]